MTDLFSAACYVLRENASQTGSPRRRGDRRGYAEAGTTQAYQAGAFTSAFSPRLCVSAVSLLLYDADAPAAAPSISPSSSSLMEAVWIASRSIPRLRPMSASFRFTSRRLVLPKLR